MSKTETSTGSTPATTPGTDLKKGSIGVLGILFFVLSAQAPLTGIAGASGLTVFLGNGAGAPGAYLTVGVVIIIFAVGFIAMSRRIRANGAFYAYVGAGLGRHTGAGAAWLALLAYGTVQACMYGLYGASLSALIATYTGVTIPWWLLVLVTMGAVQLLGSRNVELGAKFLAFLVGAEVAILLAFGISVLASGGGPEGISLSASFSPAAIAAGAPGVAIMFAVASMFGFESTAIYSDEAKDPRRTVARATYLSVSVIAIFFAFITWMLVSYYGPTAVQGAAGAAVESGDATSFFFAAAVDKLGAWAGPVGGAFLITSVLAGIIAFHNAINRYLHSLAQRGSVPARLARTNSHGAPYAAAYVQTAMALVMTIPFAILGLDPVLTLFAWFAGVAVVALLVLYVLASVAVVVFFRRHGGQGIWQTLIAPTLAVILMTAVLWSVVSNFTTLIGGDAVTANWLLVTVPVAFIAGMALERRNRSEHIIEFTDTAVTAEPAATRARFVPPAPSN